jgi:hypothetical protein
LFSGYNCSLGGRKKAKKKQRRAKKQNKKTQRREGKKNRGATQNKRIGSAIVFIPVEKRTTQKLSSTESRHLHHLLSSFIISEVAGKRK